MLWGRNAVAQPTTPGFRSEYPRERGERVVLATQRFGDIVSSLVTFTIISCVISLDDLALLFKFEGWIGP